jgi:succinate dehydrogenase/fumarate reductase flavoprotein subunit
VDFPQRDDDHWLCRIVWTGDTHTLEPLTEPAIT